MTTFPSYDYALCDRADCPKHEMCARWLTHRRAVEENYEHPLCHLLVEEVPCDNFVKPKTKK